MRALAAADDRTAALQQARTYADLARREFDADPDPAVVAAEADIRNGKVTGRSSSTEASVSPNGRTTSAPVPLGIGVSVVPERTGTPAMTADATPGSAGAEPTAPTPASAGYLARGRRHGARAGVTRRARVRMRAPNTSGRCWRRNGCSLRPSKMQRETPRSIISVRWSRWRRQRHCAHRHYFDVVDWRRLLSEIAPDTAGGRERTSGRHRCSRRFRRRRGPDRRVGPRNRRRSDRVGSCGPQRGLGAVRYVDRSR